MAKGKPKQKSKGPRSYKAYNEDKLKEAVAAVQNGMSIRKAAEKYEVTKSTLFNKTKNFHQKNVGRPTALMEEEERVMVDHLVTLGDWGYPLDHFDIRVLVQMYMKKQGVKCKMFTNDGTLPGEKWVKGFLNRHKDKLGMRMCQNISRSRAGVSSDTIHKYFLNLQTSLAEIDPACIINYDETNLTDDPGKKKCVFRRGAKYPERIMNHTKSSISVMFSGTASGDVLPPFVVYKGEHLWSTWIEGGPEGCKYGRSKSGWFDIVTFQQWFFQIAIPYIARKNKPSVIIGDNLSSHFSEDVIRECETRNIKFICLPPNATHICQPLDVAFFRPLKRAWRETLTSWKLTQRGARSSTLPKHEFPRLLNRCMASLVNKESNLIAGFKKTGIHPINEDAVLNGLPKNTSDADQRPESSSSNSTEGSRVTSPAVAVSSCVVELLEKMRFQDKPQTRQRKKIVVEPGSNVTSAALAGSSSADNSVQDRQAEKPQQCKRAKRRRLDYSPSSVDVSDEDDQVNKTHSLAKSIPASTVPVPTLNLGCGIFVLVKIAGKKSYKHFVAEVVTDADDNQEQYKVSFLKKVVNANSETTFMFPDAPETSYIEIADVVKMLPTPLTVINHRGDPTLSFAADFENFLLG